MALNEKQEQLCTTSRWDFSDLRALFLNCTLKRSPERSHTQGLIEISKAILEKNGVAVEVVRRSAVRQTLLESRPDLRPEERQQAARVGGLQLQAVVGSLHSCMANEMQALSCPGTGDIEQTARFEAIALAGQRRDIAMHGVPVGNGARRNRAQNAAFCAVGRRQFDPAQYLGR